MRIPKYIAVILLALTMQPSRLVAYMKTGNLYTTDGSLNDVQGAVNVSSKGDEVHLPSGTFHWPSQLKIDNHQITLQGAGIGNTVIIDDNTGSANLIQWVVYTGALHRLTGIEFRWGTGTSHPQVAIFNGGPRIDHCKWTGTNRWAIQTDSADLLIDHCTFDYAAGSINPIQVMRQSHGVNTYGGIGGDYAWHDPLAFGSDQFVFIEDNTFNCGAGRSIIDGDGGARVVVRHNDITGGVFEMHGTEGSGRRGVRAAEVYRNTFHHEGMSSGYNLVRMRSGSCLVHDNTINGSFSWKVALANYKTYNPTSQWGGADGANWLDVNDAGNPFYRGTVTAFNDPGTGTSTVTVAGTPWTTNQWTGYVVRSDRSIQTSPGDSTWFPRIWFGVILSNTANTLTFLDAHQNLNGSSNLSLVNGDTFTINKVTYVFDQCGRGQGTLATRDANLYAVLRAPGGTNDQVNEKSYEWNNGGSAPTSHIQSETYSIRVHEHFENNTPMPGYQEYLYPHPLVVADSPRPSPPQGLKATTPPGS